MIEADVYKEPVTCFVKHYDKIYRGSNLRTYPVQKMYLQPDVPRDAGENVASPLIHEGSSSSTNASAKVVATDQLFSPTTKRILEEIDGVSSHDQASSGSSATVKISLFEVKESEPCTESLTKAATTVGCSNVNAGIVDKPVQGAPDVDPRTKTVGKHAKETEAVFGIESPVKRSKNKEKEC